MDPPVRVACVGASEEWAAIGRDLDERVRLRSVPPEEVGAISGIDCVLCLGSLPAEHAAGWPPTIVLTDDEADARTARAAGVRVIPKEVVRRPETLIAQIGTAAERGAATTRDDLASTVIDTVTDVIYAFDEEGFIHWNDRLAEVTGLDDAELASMHPVDLVSGEDTDRIAALIADCDPDDLPVTTEAELPRPDGRSTPYEFTNSRLDADRRTVVCGIGRDVTEYRRTVWTLERLLETTRELMVAEGRSDVADVTVAAADRVLGLTHTGIHFVDAAGKHLEPVAYTDTVEDSLGTVPALVRGECLAWEVFESGEDGIFEGVHEEAGAHNPETHLRSEMIFPLGSHGVLIIAADSLDAFDDAEVYFAKLLAATATVALDRATHESELEAKNARLEEFVGVVSHDLRNPLNVAEGALSLATETGDLDHLEQVNRSHRRIREIIEGLLVLAREGRAVGETRPVILGTVAEEAWANVETEGATLVIGEDRTVHADRNRLTQLFENAFRNSVEHGPTRGQNPADSGDSGAHDSAAVTVTVEATPDGFAIVDDGPGIPESEREAALEPGYSTDEGTGFGLVIIQNIAEGHGWGLSLACGEAGGLRIEITTDANGAG
ncbi:sensor histidine kinase [Halalkalicoccus jeotgali]|nr:ATP-binding protein [Halalkalicoccus jeotgali]ELY35062.1 HTR-like protein [Halalkalicoccus jeotgali B3]